MASSTRRKVSKSRSTKTRKSSILDVRSKAAMRKLEKMMKKMTVVLVLVYADWCPHCHTYKDEVWSKVKAMRKKNSNVGIAAVNEKVMQDSPFSGAKINGYPSLLLIGKDGKLAEFKDESGQATNALPNHKDVNMLSGIVKGEPPTNYSEPMNVEELPASNATIAQDSSAIAANSNSNVSVEPSLNESAENVTPDNISVNNITLENSPSSAELLEPTPEDSSRPLTDESENKKNESVLESMSPADSSELLPPSAEEDLLASQAPENSSASGPESGPEESGPEESGPQNSSQLGGSLYMALLEAAKTTAPAAVLTTLATIASKGTKKLGRKRAGKSSRRR
jgi:thiol-disulfide isomerase/thioredoxin